MKKILILTGSYGRGHNAAANAIQNHAEQLGYSVQIFDFAQYFYEILGKLSKDIHENISSKTPFLWEKTFDFSDDKIVARIINGLEVPLSQRKFNKEIEDIKPDAALCVFPLWQLFIKNYIKKYGKTFKTGTLITDAINLHSVWYLRKDYIDNYFLIDEYTKKEFKKKFKHTKNNLITSFFPIEKEYFIDKKIINNKNITILLSSLDENFVTVLLDKFGYSDFNLTLLKGRNDKLFNKIYKKYSKVSNFKLLEFLNLKENYKNIDIMISKPGGALTCECIATDTPLIVPAYIPGQEEGNMKLLQQSECGFYESNPNQYPFLIKYTDWNRLKNNFQEIKKTNSCEIILKYLIEK